MTQLFLNQEKNGGKSLKEQICQYFISAIESGELSTGTSLPPSRELAQELGVSRDTVVRAYEELRRLEFIESQSTQGFVIKKRRVQSVQAKAQENNPVWIERLSAYGRSIANDLSEYPLLSDLASFNYGGPPADQLPKRRWKACMQYFAERINEYSHNPEILGRNELRQALAAFLARTKQINCSPDELAIFASTFTAVNLLCRFLLEPGDCIAVEEPGFGGIKNIALANSLKVVPIPVDKDGIVLEKLQACEEPLKMLYVTPTHQEPTGTTMPLARRQELYKWAKERSVWIIEDDYDGTFQYSLSSVPAIKALDQDSNVIYIAAFWKLLYPLTGLGYCVLPKTLMPLFLRTKVEAEGITEAIVQLSLATLLDEGFLEKHIRKLRSLYRERRNKLVHALNRSFAGKIEFARESRGTQWMVFFPQFEESAVLKAARSAGLPLISCANYYMNPPKNAGFLIDFSVLPEDTTELQCNAFRDALFSENEKTARNSCE